MAADIVQIEYEQIRQLAQRFAKLSHLQADIQRQIRQTYAQLHEGGWVGSAFDAFQTELEAEVFPAFNRSIAVFDETKTALLQIAVIFNAAEQEAAKLFTSTTTSIESKTQVPQDKSWWDSWGEWVHGGLDAIGLIPGLGEIADGINAIIYTVEGRYIEAGISAAAMIPILGDLGKGGKWGVKFGKSVLGEAVSEGTERVVKQGVEKFVTEGVEYTLERSVRKLSTEQAQQLAKLTDELGIPLAHPKLKEYLFYHGDDVGAALSKLDGVTSEADLVKRIDNLIDQDLPVSIIGKPDYIKEVDGANRITRLSGGGKFEFIGDTAEGIDGWLTPKGATEAIPVSLKDQPDIGSIKSLFRKIRDNGDHIETVGESGKAITHIRTPQFTTQEFVDFLRTNKPNVLPKSGVFDRIVVDCADGVFILDDARNIQVISNLVP